MEASGQLYATGALPPANEPRYSFDRRWVSPRAGLELRGKQEIIYPTEGGKAWLTFNSHLRADFV
jgi:hypothetical protein